MGRMSFLDKAKELLGKHDDKVDQALNKVGDAAKQKYGHDGQIDTATKFARERTGTGDTAAPPPPGQPGPDGQAPPPPAPGQAPPPPPQQ
ncbi:hypothetical protein GCM10009772_18520 [Pseudonocardia alni subsp. carboxydivorans]|jgi:hypothetical protein|nr:hypothetical protein BG618_02881 [Pseudonocardia autotrophica]